MKNSEQLRCNVRTVYSNVAETPSSTYPFPVGQKFAKELGYTRAVPNGVPEAAKSLTGVSNVAVFADIAEGDHVLDVGCGAGLDSYIAAQKVGLSGSVIGIDFSSEIVGRAQRTIGESY